MRKALLFVLLLFVLLLVGCGLETVTHDNLEYQTTIETKRDIVIQFKDKDGKLHNFYSENYIELEKGDKYDVEVTLENWSYYADWIEKIKKSN
jgi:major membrane immunogen (membrane-anchored lipoprotein)